MRMLHRDRYRSGTLLGRPTCMSADLGFTAILSIFFCLSSFFSPSTVEAHWIENRPKPATSSDVSAIWKRMSEIWGISPSPQVGRHKTTFFDDLQLNGKFNGLCLWIETRYRQSDKCIGNQKESPIHHIKTTWTLVDRRLKIGPAFYPPYVNSAFYFIARLLRRRSANRTQPNFDKRWTVNRASSLP